MSGDKNLRAILQDTVQAAEAYEQDNFALRQRLAELEESSSLRQIVQEGAHVGSGRRSSSKQLLTAQPRWQDDLDTGGASLYDDGHPEIVRQLIHTMRELVPKSTASTMASTQLRDVQVRLRTLASIIDSWQRKYADARQKSVGYLRELDAVKSAQAELEVQRSVAHRLAGDGWTHLSDGSESKLEELQTYIGATLSLNS